MLLTYHGGMAYTDTERPLRDPNEHSLLEDAYALFTGSTLLALGLVLMKAANIVTAGIAGVALLVSYRVDLGVGLLFFLINMPFLLLGLKTMGRAFLVKTAITFALVFAITFAARVAMDVRSVHPAFAALGGGTCCGVGMLVLIRHNTGVGGVNILALWAEKSRGWNVGYLHFLLDGAILLCSATVLSLGQLGWSVLSVAAINLVLVAYHRPGRYRGH